jgi:hypothetical protein
VVEGNEGGMIEIEKSFDNGVEIREIIDDNRSGNGLAKATGGPIGVSDRVNVAV